MSKTKTSLKTKVITCGCKNDTQDKLHGVGRRVANPTTKDEYRCTVCERLHK